MTVLPHPRAWAFQSPRGIAQPSLFCGPESPYRIMGSMRWHCFLSSRYMNEHQLTSVLSALGIGIPAAMTPSIVLVCHDRWQFPHGDIRQTHPGIAIE